MGVDYKNTGGRTVMFKPIMMTVEGWRWQCSCGASAVINTGNSARDRLDARNALKSHRATCAVVGKGVVLGMAHLNDTETVNVTEVPAPDVPATDTVPPVPDGNASGDNGADASVQADVPAAPAKATTAKRTKTAKVTTAKATTAKRTKTAKATTARRFHFSIETAKRTTTAKATTAKRTTTAKATTAKRTKTAKRTAKVTTAKRTKTAKRTAKATTAKRTKVWRIGILTLKSGKKNAAGQALVRTVYPNVNSKGQIFPHYAKRVGVKTVQTWVQVEAPLRAQALKLVLAGKGEVFTSKRGKRT